MRTFYLWQKSLPFFKNLGIVIIGNRTEIRIQILTEFRHVSVKFITEVTRRFNGHSFTVAEPRARVGVDSEFLSEKLALKAEKCRDPQFLWMEQPKIR